jgi:hypothetical protein
MPATTATTLTAAPRELRDTDRRTAADSPYEHG